MEFLKKMKNTAIFNAVVILIIGVLFCIRPIGTTGLMATIAGAVLVVVGVVDVIVYFAKRSSGFVADSLFMGILKVVIGVFALTHTEFVMNILVTILSVVVIVDGISNLESSLRLRKAEMAGWGVHMVLSILIILAGVLMLFNPFTAIATVSLIIGIVLIVDGVTAIVTILRVKGIVKEAAQDVQLEQDRQNGNVIDVDEGDIQIK